MRYSRGEIVKFSESEFIFFVHKIEEVFGGLTKSMLDRAKILNEAYGGINLKIISFSHHPDFKANAERLYTDYKLPTHIKIMNLYQSLEPKNPKEQSIQSWDKNDEEYIVEKVADKDAYRYYKNGLYIKYKSFEKLNNKLKFIDFFNESRQRVKREDYDLNGNIRRVIYFDTLFNVPKQELYYTENGHCFLSKWFKFSDKVNSIDRIVLFDENAQINKIFYSDLALEKYWINKIINMNRKTFLITDARPMDDLAISIDKSDNLYKIFVKHSIHLREPYNYDSILRSGNRAVLQNLDEVDAVVLLTNAQKKDLELRYGKRHNLYVIPHAYQGKILKPQKKDNKKIISIGRYHKDKQLDHLIKAFKKIVNEIPDAKLEFFGFGVERSNMEKQVEELGLQSNVKINDSTSNPYQEFANAAVSVLTSKYEGFGLVLLESLANGTPVISYNIKYGPSDIITHNETGVLVEPGNIDELAVKLIDLLKDQDKLAKMSSLARKRIDKFSQVEFAKKWSNLLSNIVNQRNLNKDNKNAQFHLHDIYWMSNQNMEFLLSGILYGQDQGDNIINAEKRYFWKFRNKESKAHFFIEAEANIIDNNKLKFKNIVSLKELVMNHRFQSGTWELLLTTTYDQYSLDNFVQIDASNIHHRNLEQVNFKIFDKYMCKFNSNRKGNIEFEINPINSKKNNNLHSFIYLEAYQDSWTDSEKAIYNYKGEIQINSNKSNFNLDQSIVFRRMKRLSDNKVIYNNILWQKIIDNKLIFEDTIDFSSDIFLQGLRNQEWQMNLVLENNGQVYEIPLNQSIITNKSIINLSSYVKKGLKIKPSFSENTGDLTFIVQKTRKTILGF